MGTYEFRGMETVSKPYSTPSTIEPKPKQRVDTVDLDDFIACVQSVGEVAIGTDVELREDQLGGQDAL